MIRIIRRHILTNSEKLQYRNAGHLLIKDFNHVTDLKTWANQVAQPHVNALRREVDGKLMAIDKLSSAHKDIKLFTEQMEYVAELVTDEPMSLYRDYIVHKYPNQERTPSHTQKQMSGILNLDKLTTIFISLCENNEWSLTLGNGDDAITYSPGPLDLIVFEQDTNVINEVNETDNLLTALLLIYNRKSDGDQYENYYKAIKN